MAVWVQQEDFDPGAILAGLGQGRLDVGGVASFTGLVRDVAKDQAVTAMTLEHYPGMTERKLAEIETQARDRWPLQDVAIVHRYGRLLPGDRIVFVAVASAHRAAAFEGCWFIMDYLKTRAPFWKLEETPAGAHWVDARDSDDAAADRWRVAAD